MLDILDTTKQLYMESSNKNLVITIPGKNIVLTNGHLVSESMSLKESVETEKNISFKGCNSSQFKIRCANLVTDIRGEYLEVTIQAETSEVIPLFSGYVINQSNRTYEDVVTELECYDPLYTIRNLDFTAWYASLSSSMTVKQFRDSAFSYLSTQYGITIEQESVTLVNDSLTLNKIDAAKLPKVINFGWIIESICQANARPGQYGRDGKFHYRKLKIITKGTYPSLETFPSEETYPSEENADIGYTLSMYSKIKYEPYEVEKIDGVSIKGIDGSSTSYGSATNVFNISDNLVAQMFANKSTACQNILGEVQGVWFTPCNLECVGLPWVECGDALYTNTKKNIVRSFVLQRTLTGIQALFDTVQSDISQYREKYTESEETGVSANRVGVKNNADEIVRTNEIVATKATISDLNAQTARINTLYGTTIIADAVNYGTLDGQYITANSIKSTHLTAGCVTASKISAGAITADKISADAFSGNQFQGSTFRIGNAYVLSGLYVGGNLWSATWKQFDQVPSGAYVLYHQ